MSSLASFRAEPHHVTPFPHHCQALAFKTLLAKISDNPKLHLVTKRNHLDQLDKCRAEKPMTATDVTGFDAIFSTGFFATFSGAPDATSGPRYMGYTHIYIYIYISVYLFRRAGTSTSRTPSFEYALSMKILHHRGARPL